jgi:DNA-binding Lrp family transcriptional regulator
MRSIDAGDRQRVFEERLVTVCRAYKNGRSVREISELIGMSRTTVLRCLRELRNRGEISEMTIEEYRVRRTRYNRSMAALRIANVRNFAAVYEERRKQIENPSKIRIGSELGFCKTTSYQYYREAKSMGLIEEE